MTRKTITARATMPGSALPALMEKYKEAGEPYKDDPDALGKWLVDVLNNSDAMKKQQEFIITKVELIIEENAQDE